ncbi:O-antigen ligase family protein [Aneurinibacillus migulanus]|uniref:O-antigen ligase family protein n=1 Tax=Aneurinibacillus migulanus TaxID=47500 RepID=UPI002E1F9376|nr:O-antigen ligase family protein [Aneurinibacillus migulanus]
MSERKRSIDELLLWEAQKSIDSKIAALLLITIALIPLLVRVAFIEFAGPLITGTSLDSGLKTDIFTYYKLIFMFMFIFILLLLLLYKMLGKGYEIPKSYINKPVLVLLAFILCSTFFAQYKTIALFGQYNRHDGALTYIGYIALFFIAANTLFSKEKIKWFFYALYPVTAINALMGILHFYGYELLKNSFIRAIILPSSISESAINAGSYISSTFNNPNYVSGISSMLVALFLTKAVLDENKKDKGINLFFACISFAMLLTALSTSGFLTLVVILPFIFCACIFAVNRKQAIITATSAVILFGGILVTLNLHDPRVYEESIGFFLHDSANVGSPNIDTYSAVEKVFSLPTAFAEEPTKEFSEFELPELGFGAGTGRVYEWTKTLELIKQQPIFGYGLDTLAYYFPQDDPDKAANLNDPNVIVDKPHNMYLGIAYGAGIFALAAFLVLIFRHLWEHVKWFKNARNNGRYALVVSLLFAWCAYLVQAVFNDSIIGTAIIFWVVFGMSVSIVREDMETTEQ